MGYDMRHKSLSYTNWRVREMCFNGEEERDDKIWSAYSSARFFYSHRAEVSVDRLKDDEPETAFCGACGVCCSELIEDGAPEPIIAAFLCGPAVDHPNPEAYREIMEKVYGKQVWSYVEKAVELRGADLASYNRMLARGLPEEVLAVEASYLWCRAERAVLDYQNAERNPGDEFERCQGLLLRVDDPVASELLLCYGKIAVLLNYIKPEWRPPMLNQKISIAWVCEMVYDTTIWPLPEKK